MKQYYTSMTCSTNKGYIQCDLGADRRWRCKMPPGLDVPVSQPPGIIINDCPSIATYLPKGFIINESAKGASPRSRRA